MSQAAARSLIPRPSAPSSKALATPQPTRNPLNHTQPLAAGRKRTEHPPSTTRLTPFPMPVATQALDKAIRPFRGGLMRAPKSFMIRDSGYRQRRLRTVEAKNEGLLRYLLGPYLPPSRIGAAHAKLLSVLRRRPRRVRKVDHVFFGAWEELYCAIQDGALRCFRSKEATSGGQVVHCVKLCGAHLVVDHRTSGASRGFKVVTDEKETFQFQTVRHEDLLSWLQGLSGVPGLYRRPEDFFKVGRLLGKGATCKAYECTSRLTGKEFVLKVRADVKDIEGTRGMHNELRILQKCSPFK